MFQYSEQIAKFAQQARDIVLSMDPTNDLQYLRVRSRRQEILVAPDDEYVLIVMQNCGTILEKKK